MSDGSCDAVLSRIAVRVWCNVHRVTTIVIIWYNVYRVMHDRLSPLIILLLIILRPTNIKKVAYISIATYFVFVPSLSSTDLDIVCFMLYFSCAHYAVSSVLVFAATRLAYDMYFDAYVRWSHLLFLSEVYDLYQLWCALSSVFICFCSWGNLRSRVIGACPVTTDCIVVLAEVYDLFQLWCVLSSVFYFLFFLR